jgi:O-antigen polymerase
MTFNRYLLAILSVTFLFLMHIFVPNIGGVLAQQREYIIWLGIGTIIFLGVLNAIKKKNLTESPFKIYILLFAVLLLSSSIFNPIKNMNMFVISSMRLIAGIILWLALLQFNLSAKERLSILLVVFISAVIESIIGIMQFFGLYRYIPITPAPDVGMVGGAFQQKNLFASWIATGLIISLYFISTNKFKTYTNKAKIIFFVCIALLSLNLIIAGSRAGLLGTALAMVIMLPMRKKHYSVARKNLITWLMVFFIGMAGGFYLLGIKDRLGIEKLTVKQIEWFSDTGQTSYAERILMYKTSFNMFKEKPLFGQGVANFGSLYMYHQAKTKKADPYYKDVGSSYTSHPHNELFLILSESGIAGILAVLILIYGFVKVAIKYGKERIGLYIALLTPITIHTLVEYPLWLSTAHYLLFIILIYMATSHFLKATQLKLAPYISKSLIIIVSCGYIFFTTYTIATFNEYNGLVRWYIDYMETGKAEDKDILSSNRNLYLKNWSIPMYMFAKAEDAVKDRERNKGFLDDFLK